MRRKEAGGHAYSVTEMGSKPPETVLPFASGTPLFTEKFGNDPSVLFNDEWLWDETSGPDSDSEETHEAWKERVLGMQGVPGNLDMCRSCPLEVVEPNW